MASLFYHGHTHGSGLKALLELFYGPSVEISGGFRAGEETPLFVSSLEGDLLLTSCEGRVIAEPCEADPRRQIKRHMYQLMAAVTGITWPWGSLTGIRPTYVAAELLASSDEAQARAVLLDAYGVSEAKTELALTTAKAERKLLAPLAEGSYAAYIGVPFCPTRCSYCSFTTSEGIGTVALLGDRFLDRLSSEIRQFEPSANEVELRSLYVGGGTPAALDEKQFERLLDLLSLLPLAPSCEITVEAGRADVLGPRKYQLLRDYGVSRICLNPQTMQDHTMTKLNRTGTATLYKASFREAREAGMKTINMDLIAGLQGETAEDFLASVDQVLALGPEAVTIHTLALKRGAAASQKVLAGKDLRIMPERWLEAALATAQERIRKAGYEPYYLYRQHYGRGGLENVAFAKAGHETLYNVMMMSDQYPVRGFGSPSVTKQLVEGKIKRSFSPKSLHRYLEMG